MVEVTSCSFQFQKGMGPYTKRYKLQVPRLRNHGWGRAGWLESLGSGARGFGRSLLPCFFPWASIRPVTATSGPGPQQCSKAIAGVLYPSPHPSPRPSPPP